MIFELSVYDAMTDHERTLYNGYTNSRIGAEQKAVALQELLRAVQDNKEIRSISRDQLYKNDLPKSGKVIARFEDECVRLIPGAWDNQDFPFIKEVAVMNCPDTKYIKIMLQQIVKNGVLIAGEKFIVYSASANQQKNKQVCLMQESFYQEHRSRFMCGLTVDRINERGGCNTGKYLAYTSLPFSKSVEPETPINIDDVIVLPEFETMVEDKVNFLQMEHLTIEERVMPVPVNHMDGAGMFLPGTFEQSCQIRGGWIKGAVFPFDFRRFITEKQEQGIISSEAMILDAWGNLISVNYIRDHVKIILNASQLKMWKYYDSWDEYRQMFKKNGLSICVNNMLHYPEESDPMVMSAYQFFQTIPRENFTKKNIEELCAATIERINGAKSDPAKALELMGIEIADEETELTPFYASIQAYPEMVKSDYVQQRIKKSLDSTRKKAMGGKPYIRGYYNYICPDLYAACEHWLCGIAVPEGLIPRNSAYNSVYAEQEIEEVCCLRSPHLSDCEHGIRKLEKSAECKRWFSGKDTVISTHDLLTKTLQCDVDGDETLCVSDATFISLVDRTKLPLYYEMNKAAPEEVNAENIYQCLLRSFQNSVIGDISNTLTKHLNLAEEVDLNFVRIITAYNNFCIDFPKSQYMPELGCYQEMFEEWKKREFPYFFKYAKDKKADQCCRDKDTNVRSNIFKLSKHVQNKTRRNPKGEAVSEFRPEFFQIATIKVDKNSEAYVKLQQKIIELDRKNNQQYKKNLAAEKDIKKLSYYVFYYYCNHEIMQLFDTREEAANYLVDIEYFQEENVKKDKDILWNCFGDILYNNLVKNLDCKETIPIRRNRQQNNLVREQEIADAVAEAIKELDEATMVPIYQEELDWIYEQQCKRRYEQDRYLLFILLVLYKRKLAYLKTQEKCSEDDKKYFRIYRNSKNGQKITCNRIDTWLGSKITQNGMERLQNIGAIKRIESCKKYYKVYLNMIPAVSGDLVFKVPAGNPMVYYFDYTKERSVKTCEICGRKFITVGAAKTCGSQCSRKLQLRNKNKKTSL